MQLIIKKSAGFHPRMIQIDAHGEVISLPVGTSVTPEWEMDAEVTEGFSFGNLSFEWDGKTVKLFVHVGAVRANVQDIARECEQRVSQWVSERLAHKARWNWLYK